MLDRPNVLQQSQPFAAGNVKPYRFANVCMWHRAAEERILNIQPLVVQLEKIIAEYDAMVAKSQQKDLSDLPKPDRQALVTRAVAAVRRIGGQNSIYDTDVQRNLNLSPALHLHTSSIIGVVKGLLFDVQAGYVQSIVELVHSETFGDFLEMVGHLHDAGYKDAAAVIAGSTLEAHLRALCAKHNVAADTIKPDGTSVPKKAEAMNGDLRSANVYNSLEQKNVTAWLDLRNKAAHGKYLEYTKDQVTLLVDSVRAFMARVPA